MRKILFTLLPLVLLCLSASGQVYVQNTMYHFSPFVYNPAAAGTAEDGDLRLGLLARLQWAGIPGAPRLVVAYGDTYIDDIGGVGAYVVQDELGPIVTTGINLAYSFHWKPSFLPSGTLNIGVEAGYLQKSLNAVWKFQEVFDPIVGNSGANFSASVGVPNLGAGIFYTHDDNRFYLGISGHDLLEPSIDALTFSQGVGTDSRVPRSFYLMGGYRFDLGQSSLQPTFLARTDGAVYQFDVSLYWTYNDLMTFGASHRFGESFSGMLGLQLSTNTMIGYSYDYNINGLGVTGDASSHELVLTYRIPDRNSNRTKQDGPLGGSK